MLSNRIAAWWKARQANKAAAREARRCRDCGDIHDTDLYRAIWCSMLTRQRWEREWQAIEDAKPAPKSLYADGAA